MYLNILLKRKTTPTHHFSFNKSTEISTNKEHIHRGFKEHNGLSYPFNKSINYDTNPKQLYKGFTKKYDTSNFSYTKDDSEYLKNFSLNPKTKPVELYTEYKNKYPKMSDNEYSIENWQTEAGTPNPLNRFIRQDITGRSIETIESDDNDYRIGLQTLEEHIKNKKNKLRNEIKYGIWSPDYEDNEDNPVEELKKYNEGDKIRKTIHKKWVNPVTIKPAIKKDEKYNFKKKNEEGTKNIQMLIHLLLLKNHPNQQSKN